MIPVVQGRNVAELRTGHGEGAAPAERRERSRHEIANGAEQDHRVQRFGRWRGGVADGRRAHRLGEFAGRRRPRSHVQTRAASERDLGGDVCGGAEAVDAEPAAVRQLRSLQSAIADDARAQHRGQFGIRIAVRKPVDVVGRREDVFGQTAVDVPAGVLGLRAKILGAAPAVNAFATGTTQPGHTHSLIGLELIIPSPASTTRPTNTATRHNRAAARRQLTLHDVQIGPAERARGDADQQLFRPRAGNRAADEPQRLVTDGCGRIDLPGQHGASLQVSRRRSSGRVLVPSKGLRRTRGRYGPDEPTRRHAMVTRVIRIRLNRRCDHSFGLRCALG